MCQQEIQAYKLVMYDKCIDSAAEGIVMITFGIPTIVASDEGIAILVFELPINIFLQSSDAADARCTLQQL